MKRFTSVRQKIGKIGEEISKKYLVSKKYIIVDENYTIREGEIDIIALRDRIYHFIEVKSILKKNDVSYETYNPGENMTKSKILKCQKVIYRYIQNNKLSSSLEYQLDLHLVYIDQFKGKHKIEILENIF